MTLRFHPNQCVPLRDRYEVFTVLKRNPILVDGSEWRVVEPGDAFTVTPDIWIGGAATMADDWMLFLSNGTVSKWVDLRDCSPVTADAEMWRSNLRETLDTFYGYKFRAQGIKSGRNSHSEFPECTG